MNRKLAAHGQAARDTLQLQLLENREMNDARSGLAYLRAFPEVDTHNVVLIGHSFAVLRNEPYRPIKRKRASLDLMQNRDSERQPQDRLHGRLRVWIEVAIQC
jgi:hypothetical protein